MTDQDSGTTPNATTSLPATLPALQQWTPGTGSGYAWPAPGRIMVHAADSAALAADAQTFAADLAVALDVPTPAVVYGALADPVPGDIFLSLGSTDGQLGTEGYSLSVGPVLTLTGQAALGVFWGTRTLLQLLRQSKTLPPGTARDWPQYPVRSVLLDNNSRYFPLGLWRNEIRELSYLKINELMVYVSGLGLFDEQIRELSAFAAGYHVNLVGQVNMPGHMDSAREGIPTRYQLTDNTGAPIPGALDITNPLAVAWAREQALMYMNLLSAPIWHTGGDEYPLYSKKLNNPTLLPALVRYANRQYGPNATIEDAYRAFMNDTNTVVKAQGKSMRMWNDDLFANTAVTLDTDITIEYWLGGGLSPAALAAAGYQLINANGHMLYFDENQPGGANTSGQLIWEDFDPGVFEGDQTLPGGATDPHLRGIKLSSWDAVAEDVGLLERDLQPLQRALAQRAWGSPKLFPTWAQMASTAAAVGRAPGFFDTPAAGDPGATSLPSAKAIVFENAQNTFTIQANGSLLHTYYNGGAYTTETVAAAGSAAGQPAGFASNTQQHVFGRGPDGHLHHWFTGSVAGGWTQEDWTAKAAGSGSPSLDLAGDPAGFLSGSNQHVFGRGSDGHLHHWYYNAASNTVVANDWGGQFTGNPSAVVFGAAQVVFARAADGTLHRWWWQESDSLYVHQDTWAGPLLAADASPMALNYAENQIHVFARDTAGHLQHWWYDAAAGQNRVEDWTAATGLSIAGSPSGFVFGDQYHVYFRDAASNHLDHVWGTTGLGLGRQDLSAITPGGVVALAGDPWSYNVLNAEQHAFGLDSAGHVHHWFWRESDNSLHQDTWQQ
ncbi:family 20 glycosylhydrolase [Catenulispora sp. GP43]|uniref:family 20 glycosylhydrolase n=1 Tax=Catenulispora sp. GP43 TaxID=3156263 RepID=UPI003519681C